MCAKPPIQRPAANISVELLPHEPRQRRAVEPGLGGGVKGVEILPHHLVQGGQLGLQPLRELVEDVAELTRARRPPGLRGLEDELPATNGARIAEPPVWYVLARDVDKGEPRTFRMDRIARPRILEEVVFRPDVSNIQAQLPDLERWRPLTGRWA